LHGFHQIAVIGGESREAGAGIGDRAVVEGHGIEKSLAKLVVTGPQLMAVPTPAAAHVVSMGFAGSIFVYSD